MASEIVKIPEKPYQRYWIAKVFDRETKQEVDTLLNPSWCDAVNLKCKFPSNMIVDARLKSRVEKMKAPESDWVNFDYIFVSQTGKMFS